MRINEVTKEVDLSKRAVKYYEEEGLLAVKKDQNGYRNYTEEDIRTLKEISIYRKLGISIRDVKKILSGNDKNILKRIYEEKKSRLGDEEKILTTLASYIDNQDIDAAYENLDYKSVADALQDMIPGAYGYYFTQHFLPYLQIQITTDEQREACDTIIDFFDHLEIKIPAMLRLSSFLSYKLSKSDLENMAEKMDAQIKRYIDMTEEDYEKLREQTKKNVKMKNSPLFKYHPAFVSQRKFMKRLQDCGYNDIFIPNMTRLSPAYKEYHDALTQVNDRICRDLGLYYDSNYNLVMKK